MVERCCIKCNKKFDSKTGYDRHQKRIKPCKIDNSNSNSNNVLEIIKVEQPIIQPPIIIPVKEPEPIIKLNIQSIVKSIIEEQLEINDDKKYKHKCEHCDNSFSQSCHLARHTKTCLQKKIVDMNINIKFDSLNKKIEYYENQLMFANTKIEYHESQLVSATETIVNLNSQIELLKNNPQNLKKIKNPVVNNNIDTIIDNNVMDSIYFSKNVTDYDNKNVFYMAYVGTINGENIYKYGISSRIFGRDYKEHRRTFNIFTLFYLEETDNNIVIESLFEKELHIRKIHRSLTINNKKQTELYTTSADHPIEKIIKIVIDIISNNLLPALKEADNKIKELTNNNEYRIRLEEIQLKKLELEYKIKMNI